MRILKLAPDLKDILDSHDWIEHQHGLLLTLLHPADRKALLKKNKDVHERALRRCAWIVAFHEYGHGDREANEQLYYLGQDLSLLKTREASKSLAIFLTRP